MSFREFLKKNQRTILGRRSENSLYRFSIKLLEEFYKVTLKTSERFVEEFPKHYRKSLQVIPERVS